MPQHSITICTDCASQSERTVQVTIDGELVFRLTRAALVELANQTHAAIQSLDWIWATYLYATDVNTTKQHIVRKEGSAGSMHELRQQPALCGRPPYAFPNPSPDDGWTLSPVVAHPHANTCSTCLRAYARQQRAIPGRIPDTSKAAAR